MSQSIEGLYLENPQDRQACNDSNFRSGANRLEIAALALETLPTSFFANQSYSSKKVKRELYARLAASSLRDRTTAIASTNLRLAHIFHSFKEEEFLSDYEWGKLCEHLFISDVWREMEVYYTFAVMKYVLGLRLRETVTYEPFHHFLWVENWSSSKRLYDLWDSGLKKGGGGIKQLFVDQKMSVQNEYISHLRNRLLPEIRGELMRIAEIPPKALNRNPFECAGEPLNFAFTSDCAALKNVLESREKGFFVDLLGHWGLIKSLKAIFKKPILTDNGRNALFDIYKALLLRKIVLKCVKEVEAKRTEWNPLNKVEVFEKETQALRLLSKEMQEVSEGVLHLILMALNGNLNHRIKLEEESFFPVEASSKWWVLPTDSEKEGLDPDENWIDDPTYFIEKCIQLDQARVEGLNQFVRCLVEDFEQFVFKREGERQGSSSCNESIDLEMDPENPSHQEIAKMASDLGGLIYDVARCPTRRFGKVEFFNDRKKGGWRGEQRCSRALQFLIGGLFI